MGAPGHSFYFDLVSRYGYRREAESVQKLYRCGDRAAAAAAVPAELVGATTICGTESYVRDRLAAYRETGMTHVQVVPVPQEGETDVALVGRLKELIG